MATDPFTHVHNAFWTLLEANTVITGLVPTTNRLKLDNTASPEVPPDIGIFDEPVLRVRPTQGVGGLLTTSSGSNVKLIYLIEFAVGERYINDFYPLFWAIVCALSKWEATMEALEWLGGTAGADQHFVKLCKLIEVPSQWTNRGVASRQPGWFTAMACEVSMWFKTSDMQA